MAESKARNTDERYSKLTIGVCPDQWGVWFPEDDKQIQPAQNLVPAVSTEWLADNQDVEGILNDLMAALTTEKLTELNGQVSVDCAKPEDVAKDFLEAEGLL